MSLAVFIDSNIPMYLIGKPHDLKIRAQVLLEQLVRSRRRLVTSAEVLQEICHRYQAIRAPEFIRPCVDNFLGIIDQVYPITQQDVQESISILLGYPGLSARDSLHLALMKNLGLEEVLSFDKDLDVFAGIRRLY